MEVGGRKNKRIKTSIGHLVGQEYLADILQERHGILQMLMQLLVNSVLLEVKYKDKVLSEKREWEKKGSDRREGCVFESILTWTLELIHVVL